MGSEKTLEFDLSCMDITWDDINGNYVSNIKIDDDSISFLLYRDMRLPKESLEAFSNKYNDKKVTFIYNWSVSGLQDMYINFLIAN